MTNLAFNTEDDRTEAEREFAQFAKWLRSKSGWRPKLTPNDWIRFRRKALQEN